MATSDTKGTGTQRYDDILSPRQRVDGVRFCTFNLQHPSQTEPLYICSLRTRKAKGKTASYGGTRYGKFNAVTNISFSCTLDYGDNRTDLTVIIYFFIHVLIRESDTSLYQVLYVKYHDHGSLAENNLLPNRAIPKCLLQVHLPNGPDRDPLSIHTRLVIADNRPHRSLPTLLVPPLDQHGHIPPPLVVVKPAILCSLIPPLAKEDEFSVLWNRVVLQPGRLDRDGAEFPSAAAKYAQPLAPMHRPSICVRADRLSESQGERYGPELEEARAAVITESVIHVGRGVDIRQHQLGGLDP